MGSAFRTSFITVAACIAFGFFGAMIVTLATGSWVLASLLFLMFSLALFAVDKLSAGTRRSAIRENRGRHDEVEESRMMQELYRGLSRIEERVEALETILLDRVSPSAQGK